MREIKFRWLHKKSGKFASWERLLKECDRLSFLVPRGAEMKTYKGKTKEVDATDYIKYLHKIIERLEEKVKIHNGSDLKLNWFFVDTFYKFATEKTNKKGIRTQEYKEVFNYNGEEYTMVFQRGDKLNNTDAIRRK